jgi:thiamine kinase-like enzyme
MIPQEKLAAVTRGLREAFDVTEPEEICELARGPGLNSVFRIVVRGSAFLLRINMRAGDMVQHYTCMHAAAEAGLAPRVWYTSIPDRISISDFVDTRPFPVTEALVRVPRALRILHALPPFPKRADHLNTSCTFLLNKELAWDLLIRRLQTANILPEAETEELLRRYAQVIAVYPRDDSEMVSSHNDLFKPDNILFDGKRVWLVDWEAAFLNDRYADLAVVANLIAAKDAEEEIFLQEYFGRQPNEYELARFFLLQQLSHMFYAMAFLLLGSPGKPVDWSEPAPSFSDLNRRIWAGTANLKEKDVKTAFGRVHWERLLRNSRQARFDEVLRIVSDWHASA